MLTATYCFVALSAEHMIAVRMLSNLCKSLQSCSTRQGKTLDPGNGEALVSMMQGFDENFRARKVEKYMIPLLRKATTELDPLLEELDVLSANATAILGIEYARLRKANGLGGARTAECMHNLYEYCQYLLKRLAREEEELFREAQRILLPEEWFAVAAGCLTHDTVKEAAWRSKLRTCEQELV